MISSARTSVFVVILCSCVLVVSSAAAVDVNEPAPELGAADLEGRPTRIGDLRGMVVVINFWAVWCGHCVHELPELQRLHETHVDEGLVVIGVNVDRNAQIARDFRDRAGLRFRIVHDERTRIAQRFMPPVMPSTYLVDRHGVIRFIRRGFRARDSADIALRVRELLSAL